MSFLKKKAMLVNLTITGWSGKKLDRAVSQKVNADAGAQPDIARVTKALLPKSAFDDIRRTANAARSLHAELTLPWGKDGERLLPAKMHQRYTTEMRAIKTNFDTAVTAFANEFDAAVAQAELAMGTLFSRAEYPPKARITELFQFEWAINPLPSGDDFRVDLEKEEIEEITLDIEKRTNAAYATAVDSLYEAVYSKVAHFSERNQEYLDKLGEKRNRDSSKSNLETLQRMVDLLPALNISEDPNLTELGEAVDKNILKKFTAEKIKDDPEARKSAKGKADAILSKMDVFRPDIAAKVENEKRESEKRNGGDASD